MKLPMDPYEKIYEIEIGSSYRFHTPDKYFVAKVLDKNIYSRTLTILPQKDLRELLKEQYYEYEIKTSEDVRFFDKTVYLVKVDYFRSITFLRRLVNKNINVDVDSFSNNIYNRRKQNIRNNMNFDESESHMMRCYSLADFVDDEIKTVKDQTNNDKVEEKRNLDVNNNRYKKAASNAKYSMSFMILPKREEEISVKKAVVNFGYGNETIYGIYVDNKLKKVTSDIKAAKRLVLKLKEKTRNDINNK